MVRAHAPSESRVVRGSPQIPHRPDLPAGAGLALPVDRLHLIQVMGWWVTGAHRRPIFLLVGVTALFRIAFSLVAALSTMRFVEFNGLLHSHTQQSFFNRQFAEVSELNRDFRSAWNPRRLSESTSLDHLRNPSLNPLRFARC